MESYDNGMITVRGHSSTIGWTHIRHMMPSISQIIHFPISLSERCYPMNRFLLPTVSQIVRYNNYSLKASLWLFKRRYISILKAFFFLESLKSPDHWLISDLIPKKSEKFEFRKNFVTIFFSVKNWPKKWNFDFFAHAIFEKLQN